MARSAGKRKKRNAAQKKRTSSKSRMTKTEMESQSPIDRESQES
jgi:hypothetical protein